VPSPDLQPTANGEYFSLLSTRPALMAGAGNGTVT
jgi:hypothetical protein